VKLAEKRQFTRNYGTQYDPANQGPMPRSSNSSLAKLGSAVLPSSAVAWHILLAS
jgi:hypothetical protein